MKLKLRHFSFRLIYRRIALKDWQLYYSIKNKKGKRGEYDKFCLKEFRAQLHKDEIKVVITHKPSRQKYSFVVDKVNRRELMDRVRKSLQEDRKKLKAPVSAVQKNFEGAPYKLVGGIFTEPGSIPKLGKLLKINDPTTSKKPKTPYKKYIGVELEFNAVVAGMTVASLGRSLQDAGLARYLQVGTDPSCGFEVRVLLEEEGFEVPLRKIMDHIKNLGFTAENNCGTHVHFDMRKRDVKKVYKNLALSQTFLRKFMTKTRKHNRFCRMNPHTDFDEQLQKQIVRGGPGRYYGINTLSYETHGTLEIRMHQGTLDADTLIPYIKTLLKIINYQGEVSKNVNTLKQARLQYGIETDLNAILAKRIGYLFGRTLTTGT